MIAASAPGDSRNSHLLCVDVDRGLAIDRPSAALAAQLEPRDVLVVNDAATLPASLHGCAPDGSRIELRLAAWRSHPALLRAAPRALGFRAVLFGAGDWRTPTERRPQPAMTRVGERFRLGEQLVARVDALDAQSARLIDVTLLANDPHADLWSLLYAHGRPIQYAHVPEPLALWDVQNVYAARPWSFEMPSAGRVLHGSVLLELRRRGVEVVSVSHAAGISSTGDATLDRRLPLAEHFEVSVGTARTIARAQRHGGRVIAVGTSVVRALESATVAGIVRAGRGLTSLRISDGYRRQVVDAVLSGVHEPGSSHFELLQAFADSALLNDAYEETQRLGYRNHEFGDFTFVVAAPAQRLASALSA